MLYFNSFILKSFFLFDHCIFWSILNFNFRSILLFSSFLAFSDYLRAKILTGFPWNLWAYSFSWATEILQVLNIFGLFALQLNHYHNFYDALVIFLKINLNNKLFLLSLTLFTLFVFYIYGDHSINQNKKIVKLSEQKFNIKVISPNFKLEIWSLFKGYKKKG